MSDERGFSLLEVIMIGAIVALLCGMAIGVTGQLVTTTRAESGAQQLDGFLRRQRALSVARRRDIEIRFTDPNRVQSFERAVPPPGTTLVETLTIEGDVEFRLTAGVPDTPNAFGNATARSIGGGVAPIMFTPEGALIDGAQNPVNVTLSLGIESEPLSATAVTILGATASVERWRWNGNAWAR